MIEFLQEEPLFRIHWKHLIDAGILNRIGQDPEVVDLAQAFVLGNTGQERVKNCHDVEGKEKGRRNGRSDLDMGLGHQVIADG